MESNAHFYKCCSSFSLSHCHCDWLFHLRKNGFNAFSKTTIGMLRETKMQKITSQILNTKRAAIIYSRTNSLFCAIISSCFLLIVFVAIFRSIWIKANWNELAYVSYCVSIAISREDTNKKKHEKNPPTHKIAKLVEKNELCVLFAFVGHIVCWSQVYPHPRIWVLVVREYNRFHFGDIDWHLCLFFSLVSN